MSDQSAPVANATIGHNIAKILTPEELAIYLDEQHAGTETAISTLLANAKAEVPKVIESDADDSIVSKYVADIRVELDSLEAKRVAEKAPYLAAERAIDSWFKSKATRLTKASEIIHARGHDYNVRKEAAERARLTREANERIAAANKAAAEARAAQQEADEAAAAAARARKPERIEVLQSLATEAAQATDAAQVEALATHTAAVAAHAAASAKPAELVRTHHDTGGMTTMQQEGFAEVEDRTKLDFAVLAPFLKIEHIEMALKKWAAQNDFKSTMAGAKIGKRPKTVYR